jgi:hypothetical protein
VGQCELCGTRRHRTEIAEPPSKLPSGGRTSSWNARSHRLLHPPHRVVLRVIPTQPKMFILLMPQTADQWVLTCTCQSRQPCGGVLARPLSQPYTVATTERLRRTCRGCIAGGSVLFHSSLLRGHRIVTSFSQASIKPSRLIIMNNPLLLALISSVPVVIVSGGVATIYGGDSKTVDLEALGPSLCSLLFSSGTKSKNNVTCSVVGRPYPRLLEGAFEAAWWQCGSSQITIMRCTVYIHPCCGSGSSVFD